MVQNLKKGQVAENFETDCTFYFTSIISHKAQMHAGAIRII